MKTLKKSSTPWQDKRLTMWCYQILEKSIVTGGIKQQRSNYNSQGSWVLQTSPEKCLGSCQTLRQYNLKSDKIKCTRHLLNASLQFQCIRYKAQLHSFYKLLRVKKQYSKKKSKILQSILHSRQKRSNLKVEKIQDRRELNKSQYSTLWHLIC